ncbi:flagellar hook-length control protein FliK [Bradyrhizobium sp.]|uniref:flagellar hook-length control protein FliK n=1 Tax=Bradyrhizobium sp. TaxID=376 RepID=UPI001ECE593B|nr:flagellar hook-length control protein FliK [Bradyrhizobium sp.]MBV8921384.1 flagellar hook-length control protein FliK [Bradyrhizobium sp.]MBV9980615.1 flagellar hook-length control protein FliK [Bradyrhizobium sp.]
MALTVNPSLPVAAVSAVSQGGSATDLVLQPGTVVTAQVQNLLADNLVRIAIANLSLDVLTEVPLQAGQTLQLAVSQSAGNIRLAVIGQGGATTADAVSLSPNAPLAGPAGSAAPGNDPLTPLERIAVSVATEAAATRQESLAPLFADLGAAATSTNLPPALQNAVRDVLAQQTPLAENLSSDDIQVAFQGSGLFLEASLAARSGQTGAVPDLKAALVVLRQTLTSALSVAEPAIATESAAALPTAAQAATSAQAPVAGPPRPGSAAPVSTASLAPVGGLQPEPGAALGEAAAVAANPGRIVLTAALADAPRGTAQGAVLTLLQEALQQVPRAGNLATAKVAPQNAVATEVAVRTPTPPPPFRGGLPSPQPVAQASITPNTPLPALAHRLLESTDAAIARQTLLQVASLPERVDTAGQRTDQAASHWNFEIPFATPQGTAMAQFEISRDGGGSEAEASGRVWRARFSLNVEPAGPVHALISLSGERTSVRMWAERPATAAQLKAGSGELSQALSRAELVPGDIIIREGAPPQVAPAKAGHFLDRAL